MSEEDIEGVQIFPAQWPRKVLISIENETAKESLMINGLSIDQKHIDLKDEDDEIIRVTVRDAMINWEDDVIEELLSPYGKIIEVENEFVRIDGQPTKWKTGTRFVFMSHIDQVIPSKLTTTVNNKESSVTIWYRRPVGTITKCYKCGGQHDPNKCNFPAKVCFICKGNHQIRECPQNDGSRSNETVFCFMTERSPFSNFNMNFPIKIEQSNYNCNEQYIQSQKAAIFKDWDSCKKIMASSDPREMKRIGRRISGYVNATWKDHSRQVIMDCVRSKVYSHAKMQELLLATANKFIGEGTPDSHFGVGIHIRDPRVLNTNEWSGNNIMGKALMEVRSEMQLLKDCRNNTSSEVANNHDITDSEVLANSTPCSSRISMSPEYLIETLLDNESSALGDSLGLQLNDIQVHNRVVVIGDSNAKRLQLDDTYFEAEMICRSGADILDVTDMLEECQSDPTAVENVVVHLGTCNWSSNANDTVVSHASVYSDYVEALNLISSKFPQADMQISSVPPRKPTGPHADHMKKSNEQIASLNEQLKSLALEEANITFIDNDLILTVNGEPIADLYKDSDKTGVHMNNVGLTVLSNNISIHLNEIFTKSSNESRWNTQM